ncbi:hypothetical protein PIB30_066456 [Stylosanthes scabra]|uniref:Protein FAR1-RELATED SEQUENCE n=1 Tax=Stylosanthes scabra TaxID=79078 RepID=A0ABU6RMH7_9FABA|nr:hypothetical protein [Stylosanthes scabra]
MNQAQFMKKGDCMIQVLSRHGDMYSLKVDEQKLIGDQPVIDTYKVSFDLVVHECHCECNLFGSKATLCCHMLLTFSYFQVNEVPKCYISSRWSKNVRRKHTYIKSSHDVNCSDESNNIFRGLRSHFFNVAQEFVSDIEDASILHLSIEDALIKLYGHRASKLQSSVPNRQSSNPPESQRAINVDRLLSPPQVSTKGRPSNRRLGADLDKPIKNTTRRFFS